eukprot:1159931-Pelagomonas_calceolata.AAC.4
MQPRMQACWLALRVLRKPGGAAAAGAARAMSGAMSAGSKCPANRNSVQVKIRKSRSSTCLSNASRGGYSPVRGHEWQLQGTGFFGGGCSSPADFAQVCPAAYRTAHSVCCLPKSWAHCYAHTFDLLVHLYAS